MRLDLGVVELQAVLRYYRVVPLKTGSDKGFSSESEGTGPL